MHPRMRLPNSVIFEFGMALCLLIPAVLILWTLPLVYWGGASLPPSVLLIGISLLAAAAIALLSFWLYYRVVRPLHGLIEDAQRLLRGESFPVAGPKAPDDIIRLREVLEGVARALDSKKTALLREHGEYLQLFESVPCLITVQDRNLRLIRFNQEFADKFAPRDGDYCYSAYKGRSEKCEHCPVEKTFQDGQSHAFEEEGWNRDGEPIRWLARTAPIFDKGGNVVAAMEMSLDITLSRQLEEKLKASEERYQAIFSNIPNAVFVLEPETLRILDCNDSVEPVYGFRREDLRDKSFLDLFDPGDRDAYAAKIGGETFIHQARQHNRDGRPLFVDIRASLTPYPEWKVLLVTTSDISQQIEIEQQLIQASKMTTLGEMATGVAHELNQPLSVMKTASSFMLKKFSAEQAVSPDILETMLRKIDANVDRATSIIQHMRQFARKADVDLEPVDINRPLLMALDIFSEQLKLRGIRLNKVLAEDLPRIRGSAGRLEQVFINLLLNARDAIEERWGDDLASSDEKVITLTTRLEDGCVTAAVCDTGKGVPPSLKEKIFEPFFTTKNVGKGTGLGLSISYGIVKQCGGTIEAGEADVGGACFILSFPPPENP